MVYGERCLLAAPLLALLGCAAGESADSGLSGATVPMTAPQSGTDGTGEPTTGEPGTDGTSGTSGASAATAGTMAVCGDGKVEGAEVCDDGNADNTDDCLDTCVAASCGDGEVQAGVEDCDDGNDQNIDACLATCEAAKCGDGFQQALVEECDDGNAVNTDGCLDTCAAASCGDSFVWDGVESCDDGNDVDADGCNNACATAGCGDGVVAADEACDDGNKDNSDACLDTCKPASCGDGVIQVGVEVCDDGGANNDATGPCRSDCTTCQCQGADVMGKTCKDVPGFTCGKLACGGCSYDTSGCASPQAPNFNGQVGPDFSADGCWLQCEGYLDAANVDDVPAAWGDDCAGPQFSKIRIACGANASTYRYITVSKNVFKDGLAAYPEVGLIVESRDQNKVDFATSNEIYATGNHPHSGASWWGNGNGCQENSPSITVNNSCSWDVANCFGQNLAGDRYMYVYASP